MAESGSAGLDAEAVAGGRAWPLRQVFTFTTPWRQALFYALLFAGAGASMPYISLWLGKNGMNAGQIGIILAIPLLARAITGPLSGIWADRFIRYRSPMLILALSGAIAYGLMGLSDLYGDFRFAAFMVLYAIGFTCINNIGPLLDAMTLQLARVQKFSYALSRAAGSVAFVLATVGLGFVLQDASPDMILVFVVASALAVAVVGRLLLAPHPRLDHSAAMAGQPRQPGMARFRVVMGNEGLVLLLVACGCLQAAHSFYYAFSTIIWQGRGFSATLCGLLWAAAIVGEIAFLGIGGRLRHRLGPWRLLMLGAAVGVVRWGLMMLSPPLWVLWPLQLLHGFSFAAVYLAGLDLVFQLAPHGYEGLAQSVNSAYAAGVMTGLATLASGMVFQGFGPRGYGLMAALAAAGLACAIWLYRHRDRLLAARSDSPAPA